ncbi:class I adenylate-forming enzyme family protein [Pseudonocardia sp. RS010]|uniref:class I adenylate-forming enzyme family protein n=1 Tax=Pseudonocardia sp. RS010 TaxID=3385979 RepID=UPI0039A22F29
MKATSAADVPQRAPSTLGDLLMIAAREYGDRTALAVDEDEYTYAELLAASARRAAALRRIGIRRGDHVALFLPNGAEFVELLFANALLGAVTVPLGSRFQVTELAHAVPHSQAKLVVTGGAEAFGDHQERLARALPELAGLAGRPPRVDGPGLAGVVSLGEARVPGVTAGAGVWDGVDEEQSAAVLEGAAQVRGRDEAVLLYTSGTTANPKAVRHPHEAIVRNGIETGRTRFLLTSADLFWDPLPMTHVAYLLPLVAVVDAGATMLATRHFDARSGLDAIERRRATWLYPAFPAVANDILEDPTFAGRDLGAVRMMMLIGLPAQLRRLRDALPHADLISCYGSTETCGVIVYHEPEDEPAVRLETSGRPMRGIEVVAGDPVTGEHLPPGEVGEILVRGHCILDGYFRDDTGGPAVVDADGWFHTGDLGVMDERGRLGYRGRVKEMMKVGGENVAAAEVESLLMEHPAVLAVQAVGVPDDRLGEVVGVVVQLAVDAGGGIDAETVIGHCRGVLAGYKVPRHVGLVETWPMSATKIKRNEVRRLLVAAVSGAPAPGLDLLTPAVPAMESTSS